MELPISKWLMCANNIEIRKQILEKAHNTRYSAHLGGTKIYRDLR